MNRPSSLLTVQALNLASLSARVTPEGEVRFKGTISLRSPADVLLPFLKAVHEAALRDRVKELTIDITELSFMNSSSIRLLVTWLDWVLAEPTERRYVFHFQTNAGFTWQKTTLSVLKTLDRDLVRVTAAS